MVGRPVFQRSSEWLLHLHRAVREQWLGTTGPFIDRRKTEDGRIVMVDWNLEVRVRFG